MNSTHHHRPGSMDEQWPYLLQPGYSIGMKPLYENDDDPDMPSTSGLNAIGSRTALVGREPNFAHVGKRIRSPSDGDDDDDTVSTPEQSQEQRPGKRRNKTDRTPTSLNENICKNY